MKKTLLTALVVSGLAASAMAQGTINFLNFEEDGTFTQLLYGANPASPGTAQTGSSAQDTPAGTTVYGGPLLQVSRYVAQLWGGPSTVTDPSLLVLVTSASFFTAPGNAFPAGVFETVNGTIPGVTPGTTAKLEVRVVDTQNAAFTGRSGLFTSGPLGGSDTSGNIFLPPDTKGFTSFSIAAVPEPGTFALAGLGAAALLIFRRRK